eukprot:TRINITY_DN8755_c0_g1_i1.p3 TRINITY_DN8755_c0_g1~~TRINITY_DN8755_c0_g1_i1.p3  ORF type:complete len:110 (+),score=1.79 TRINITY_DN8755_c0_g1_i1:315-644(+)
MLEQTQEIQVVLMRVKQVTPQLIHECRERIRNQQVNLIINELKYDLNILEFASSRGLNQCKNSTLDFNVIVWVDIVGKLVVSNTQNTCTVLIIKIKNGYYVKIGGYRRT